MIDLSPYDSAHGQMPLSAPLFRDERVLHLHLWTREEPQESLVCALADNLTSAPDDHYRRIDWPLLVRRPDALAKHVLRAAGEIRPTIVWMQLQTRGVVDGALLAEVRKLADPSCVIVSWCGDVGRDPKWSHELAPHVDAMLFSSMTQVREHRALGFSNAAYLQIGYDELVNREPPSGTVRERGIVFAGQNYHDATWARFLPDHEAWLRRDAVRALATAHLRDFDACPMLRLCGGGWKGSGVLEHAAGDGRLFYTHHQPYANREAVAQLYQSHTMALSISLTSQLERYTSDRLFRALACGPCVFVKRFDDCEALGLKDGVNCVLWETPEDLVSLVELYSLADAAREFIGLAGAELARAHHTWLSRMREQQIYINAIRRVRGLGYRPGKGGL